MKNDRSIRTAAKATGLIAALITVTAAPDADAQVLARFALRLEGGAGMMISEHQRTTLGFDGVAIQGSARLAVSLVDALAIHSWHSLLRRTVDWTRPLEIGYGALEATTQWLEAGDALVWTVRLMQV